MKYHNRAQVDSENSVRDSTQGSYEKRQPSDVDTLPIRVKTKPNSDWKNEHVAKKRRRMLGLTPPYQTDIAYNLPADGKGESPEKLAHESPDEALERGD